MIDAERNQLNYLSALEEKLNEVSALAEREWPKVKPVVDGFVSNLREARAGARAPKVGETLPDFVLPDRSGKLASLSGYLSAGPAIVSFFRGRWCPYCTTTKEALDEVRSKAAASGVSLIGITPERPSHFIGNEAQNSIDVLCDVDNGYALSLNLVVHLNGAIAALYRELGVDPGEHQVGGGWFVPIPATFVVGRDGRILARFVDVDFRSRFPLDEFLDRARSA